MAYIKKLRFGDWLKITKLKMGMSKETSFALFVCSQQLIPIPGETNLLNLEIEVRLKYTRDFKINFF
jgi:hypothetical protein